MNVEIDNFNEERQIRDYDDLKIKREMVKILRRIEYVIRSSIPEDIHILHCRSS